MNPDQISLAEEQEIQLFVNSKSYCSFCCTPDYIQEMILGRLISDGIICSGHDITSIRLEQMSAYAEVITQSEQEKAPAIVSGQWQESWVEELFQYMMKGTPLFQRTGSTHCCILLKAGKILCCMDDIGRHNAFDKVVGWALLHEIPLSKCVVFSSGRVPSDMIRKASNAGVTVLAAKGLPTQQALALAQEKGITLLHRSAQYGFLVLNQPEGRSETGCVL